MLIKEFSVLNEEVVREIRDMEQICKKHDGLNGYIYLENSLNFDKNLKNTFLAYENNQLVSLVFMFVPRKEEAEISAYTLPQYRQKGYFKALLAKGVDELKRYAVPDILLVCETQSLDGKETIKKLDAPYDFTEYSLRYKKSESAEEESLSYKIKLHRPSLEDLETLVCLGQSIFDDSCEDTRSMILKSFESEDRIQYAATLNDEFIGMGTASYERDEVSICGFGISPQHQGKGFGKELLYLIIADLMNQNKTNITIDVDSGNKKAFDLYRKCGFEVESSIEHYRKRVVE